MTTLNSKQTPKEKRVTHASFILRLRDTVIPDIGSIKRRHEVSNDPVSSSYNVF